MLKARLYARVSNDEQVKYGHSIEAQITALKKYCDENKIKIMDVYKDEGISAATVKKRKSYQKMIDEVENGELILFTKLDRFSRNLLEANIEVKKLEEKNVSIKAIHEDDIDTSNADGKFIFNLKLSLAEREREKTSERIKDVFKFQAQRGNIISGSIPFGFRKKDKKYVIEEKEAESIRYAFDCVILYHNIAYAYRLYKEKYPQFKTDHRTFRRKLANPIYIGKHQYNDNFCEPIIEKEKFDEVQKIIASKNIKERANNSIFYFSRLCQCAECGRSLSGNKNTYRNVKNEKRYMYVYRCTNAYQNRICTNRHTYNEKKIEKYLLDNIKPLIEQHIVDIETQNNKSNIDYSSKISTIKKKMSKLKDLYLDDLIEKDEYRKDFNDLKEQLNKYEQLNSNNDFKDTEQLKKFLDIDIQETYEKLDRRQKQALWQSVIEKIIIDKDFNIKVIFK